MKIKRKYSFNFVLFKCSPQMLYRVKFCGALTYRAINISNARSIKIRGKNVITVRMKYGRCMFDIQMLKRSSAGNPHRNNTSALVHIDRNRPQFSSIIPNFRSSIQFVVCCTQIHKNQALVSPKTK